MDYGKKPTDAPAGNNTGVSNTPYFFFRPFTLSARLKRSLLKIPVFNFHYVTTATSPRNTGEEGAFPWQGYYTAFVLSKCDL